MGESGTSNININNTIQKDQQVPSKVSALYSRVNNLRSKNAPERRGKSFKLNSPKIRPLESFFKTQNEKKQLNFESSRSLNTIAETALKIPSIENSTIPQLIEEAKHLTNEFHKLKNQPEQKPSEILNMLGNVINTMNKSINGFLSTIETQNKCILDQCNMKISACTSYVQQEVNDVRQELSDMRKNDELEALKTATSCAKDLKKVWFRFAYKADAESFKNAGNYTPKIREMLQGMGIDINIGPWPIENVYFQSRKFFKTQIIPELALCCIFTNPAIARKIKAEIREFNNQLNKNGQSDMKRYFTYMDWSPDVWKILRICNELCKQKVIQKVIVTPDGIKIQHRKLESSSDIQNSQYSFTFVNSIKMLDQLRESLNDYNYRVSAIETYDTAYFQLNDQDRKKLRDDFYTNLEMNDGDTEIQYEEDQYEEPMNEMPA